MRTFFIPALAALLLFVGQSSLVFSQNASLQTPDKFLGYELGSRFTYHHRVLDYFEHVAEQSDEVQLQYYGETNEVRPLALAFVTSKENMENIDQIRQNNLIKTGLASGEIKGKQLPIVWMSYNVHGNESVSTEAVMQTLYELISGTEEKAEDWLKDMIVVLDPCINPDGRDRYANWYNQVVGVNPDVHYDSWEHNEPWPGGRYNHYLFDLNRDWLWQTQIETQQRMKVYHQWMPHVHVDFHEMSSESTYYFAPAAHPYHEVITKWQNEFQEHVGHNHARHFDEEGWLYFTKEVFDLLYPSYGDTYPIYNGAIGFTYEQGGSGQAGLAVLRNDEDTLTLRNRIDHHHTTGLSTIETSYTHRDRLLKEFNSYFSTAASKPVSEYKSFVVKGSNDPARLQALLDLLDAQHIKYGYSKGSKSLKAFSYLNNKEQNVKLNSNDIVVSAYQPQSNLIQVIFEPKTMVEDSLTYDLTAWALPYVYELETYASTERISTGDKAVKISFEANKTPEKTPYAYLVKWSSFNDVQFLASLLKAGVRVRFSEKDFQLAGQRYGKGTLIINKYDNRHFKGDFNATVNNIANAQKITLTPAKSGFVESGKDFGSSKVSYINKPKVALLAGHRTLPTSVGELWHYFEQDLDYPVTLLRTDYFSTIDLNDYDVLVLPAGYYSDEAVTDKVLTFAKEGGKVIAIDNAVDIFANAGQTDLSKQMVGKKSGNGRKDNKLLRYEDDERSGLSNRTEGSIYQAHLDDSHPLAFGAGKKAHFIKRNNRNYPYLNRGWNVGYYKKDSYISGFAGTKLKKRMNNSLAMGVEEYGSGEIIYFPDSPVFRSFWHGGKLLLGNAVFLVGQ